MILALILLDGEAEQVGPMARPAPVPYVLTVADGKVLQMERGKEERG